MQGSWVCKFCKYPNPKSKLIQPIIFYLFTFDRKNYIMKKLLFAVAFLLPFMVSAQSSGQFNYKAEDRYLYYSDVVKVDTMLTVPDLYKDAKLFFKKLVLINTKITSDDQSGGVVAADIVEESTYKSQSGVSDEPMTVQYSFKIEVKKGRYRYTIDNITITTTEKDNKKVVNTLYDIDKGKDSGVLGINRNKRILKAMDALFLRKIDVLSKTMSKRSDDF